MNAEHALTTAKAYRMYFSTETYDYVKYRGHIKTGPLLHQRDRQFYYRLSTKLNDEQIHATLLLTHFFKPNAYINEAVSPQAMAAGVALASRAENGITVLKHDLYDLRKRLTPRLLDAWLYAPMLEGQRASIPDCISDILNGTLPVDLACLLLLIPQAGMSLQWPQYWEQREAKKSSFGVRPWLSRLRKADQLFNLYRPGWRRMSHLLSNAFWSSYQIETLAPEAEEHRLFA